MNVLMPQLGETVSEGKVTKWFKAVGDAVTAGENLCEIETDKVTVEVPATESGILRAINVQAGSIALVGAVIAALGDGGALAPALPASSTVQAKPAQLDPFKEVKTPPRNFGPARMANGVTVTPLARRLADKGAIDISQVAGSGAHGRITSADVEKAIAARPSSISAEPVDQAYRTRPHTVVPIDGMRRTIARRLVISKSTIPHFYLTADIAIDRLSVIRKEMNAGANTRKLTINDFMIRSLALALQVVPHANAIWSSEGILAFQHSDIGVAVAIPGGLLTPVIFSAESKSLTAISDEVKQLAARAKNRALQPHEYQGGASTISNLGMHNIREFSAIINPPQSTILAIGASRRDAVETDEGGVAFVSRIAVTLSCDHRVVDGMVGVELLKSFQDFVENPLRMVV